MSRAARILLAILAVALAAPQLRRHEGERHLYRATALLEIRDTRGPVLRALREEARNAEALLPNDARSLLVEIQALLDTGRGEEARELARRALAKGERSELDLALARAEALAGNEAGARAALTRALWVSPSLPASGGEVRRELEERGRRLESGATVEVPPAP